MRLAELCQAMGSDGWQVFGDAGVEISGITNDSRKVTPGDLFVCVHGFKKDGHAYIGEAFERGARAVVVQRAPPGSPEDVALRMAFEIGEDPIYPSAQSHTLPWVEVTDSRRALASMATALYGHPTDGLRVVGVTGTNGKTTTAFLLEALFTAAGKTAGLIGTIYNRIAGRLLETQRTTPDSVDLQQLLRQMVDSGVTHVAMEVSSHALELSRTVGCEFDVAILTNVTRDHFDFHGTFERYLGAKAKLFADLGKDARKPGPKAAVLNVDDPSASLMAEASRAQIVTFGLNHPADVTARNIRPHLFGNSYVISTPVGEVQVTSRLPGRFNIYNSLAMAAVALIDGLDLGAVKRAVESLTGVPGRFEIVDCGQPYTVVVDFAHNPDALQRALEAAREQPHGRTIIVFGCEGDKDRTKRPYMGDIAVRLADFAIITSDNTHSEDPAAIIAEIEKGIEPGFEDKYTVIIDRYEAIREALSRAGRGDMVIIAGKGHETTQVFDGWARPFDDRLVVRELLAAPVKGDHWPDR
ncbi:MAG: UDP-N-acetylmuramoyl-L-alanyl-D-glutamate--2,6-diaminopimelate ligase [Bacillota bacterium]